jgi:DEAD/DEAH box helicase domain-containing protein
VCPLLGGNAEQEATLSASPGVFADFPADLNEKLVERLQELGIEKLYAHQAEAIESALAGHDTVTTVGTSSGKTLCYALPMLQKCLEEPSAKALLLFPTKALAHDQLDRLQELAEGSSLMSSCYDGDTPKSRRSMIRSSAHLILTNPDMLHMAILPQHEHWRKFFKSLRVIVLDEVHVLRGAFGSHTAWVLRRLLRLCEWYGSKPLILASSATLPNAEEHFENLTGRTPVVISQDAAPSSDKKIYLIEAPDDASSGFETPNMLTARLLAELAMNDVRTLAFCKARTTTELVVRQAREHLKAKGAPTGLIDSYRGGYTAKERRDIEKRLFKGSLSGLAATNAMELGVDVGGLDAVILNGYPGSLSSFWQQVGRCGRAGRPGAAVFIAHEDPLEQHLVRDPHALLNAKEAATVSIENPQIAESQLRCAAFERPIAPEELEAIGPSAVEAAERLGEAGELEFNAGRWFYPSYDGPAFMVNIRGSSAETFVLRNGDEVIGDMEEWRAYLHAHAGAVYLHRDRTFVVTKLDLQHGEATLQEDDPGYWTRTQSRSLAQETARISQRDAREVKLGLAGLKITIQATGYQRIKNGSTEILGHEELDLPPLTWDTIGVALDFHPEFASFEDPQALGGLHGLEHALMAAAPLIAGCDPRDLDSVWFAIAPETMAPRIVVFDQAPGGLGFSAKLYEEYEDWIRLASKIVLSCSCEHGCPKCMLSPRCSTGNEPLSKPELKRMLDMLLA